MTTVRGIDRETFLFLFDRQTQLLERAAAALTSENWHGLPLDRIDTNFQPVEVLVHVAVADLMFARHLVGSLGLGKPYTPPASLTSASQMPSGDAKRDAMRSAVLQGSRELLHSDARLNDIPGLIAWLTSLRTKVRETYTLVPSERYGDIVSHPCTGWRAPVWLYLMEVSLNHSIFHLGGFTTTLKLTGDPESVNWVTMELMVPVEEVTA